MLASVPGLIASNFTEKSMYNYRDSLPLSESDFNDMNNHTTSTPNKSQPRLRKQPIIVDGERFNPFLKISITRWDWVIQNTEGISKSVMALINLTNSSVLIGSMVNVCNGSSETGMAVKLLVDSITGVEGKVMDTRQK